MISVDDGDGDDDDGDDGDDDAVDDEDDDDDDDYTTCHLGSSCFPSEGVLGHDLIAHGFIFQRSRVHVARNTCQAEAPT